MSVDAIGLSTELLKAVKACGYKNLTPIQQQAIPLIRSGCDVLASAQTGTGKTAAFSLPILDLLAKSASQKKSNNRSVRALILSPTRELAMQITKNIQEYAQFMDITCGLVCGGKNMDTQVKLLKGGVDILVATPGRLIEHINARSVDLSHVKHVVLDEADRMLDMGFLTAIQSLIETIKQKHQTLMFSATFSNKVKTLAKQLLHTPKTIEVSMQNSTAGKIKQQVYWVSETRKRELLSELIGVKNWRQVLVFAGTKASADLLAKELKLDGIKCAVCHGDKNQGARNKAIEKFTEGSVRVLVATDVAARGLDIPNLPYVVNFHLPFLAEDYIHRIGRTGRAGKKGNAISLVSPKDEQFLDNIEELIGRKFERIVYPGYEMDLSLPESYADSDTKKLKKSRYKAMQEHNQMLERKQEKNKPANIRREKAKSRKKR
ncbi:DEAD/DEAH box helicase [Psychromonas sp. CNPT3]|uniref:DEAD/DEAH box helicase n=1 Tax=Psychromonas sp. CNPT3 TaxID=314282 RepID=UPI0005A1567A|nr:DEAD/DEAH box helicase [Psychromonas sp. CNPT3]